MSKAADTLYRVQVTLEEMRADPLELGVALYIDTSTLLFNVATLRDLPRRPPGPQIRAYLLDTMLMHSRLRQALHQLHLMIDHQELQVAMDPVARLGLFFCEGFWPERRPPFHRRPRGL